MTTGLTDLCAEFRADQRRIGVTLVADSPQARRLLAAFALFPLPAWSPPITAMPEDPRARWLWLWSGYKGGPLAPDFLDQVAVVASISAETAFRIWPALMTSRLLFPDGQLSEVAQAFLESNAERAMPRPRTAPAPTTKAQTTSAEDDKEKT